MSSMLLLKIYDNLSRCIGIVTSRLPAPTFFAFLAEIQKVSGFQNVIFFIFQKTQLSLQKNSIKNLNDKQSKN